MDRHALPGEDARQTQRRLYLESLGKVECVCCGRVGTRQFAQEPPVEGRAGRRYRCANGLSCGRRSRQRDRATLARLHEVSEEIFGHRFVYGDEDDLQAAVAGALRARRWAVVREHPLAGRDRIDLYLPSHRIGVEVKVAGQPGAVLGQCLRYLAHPDVDGLVLVTSRVRHRIPAELAGKPVSVVQIAARAL